MSLRFEEETAVTPLGGGRYRADFTRDWFVFAGPNGGIVAAVLLRACIAEVADAVRSPRTLTVHYLAPPGEGPAEVQVSVERAGRGVSFLSARLFQRGEAKATALVAFGAPRAEVVRWSARPVPAMAPVEQCRDLDEGEVADAPPIRHRWECREAFGPEGGRSGPTAGIRTGGWLRARTAAPVDVVLVAAMADAWLPPLIAERGDHRFGVPTVELTVHFRDTTTLDRIGPADWLACSFSTDVAQEGFLEEDGLIWSADGRLVAMSRQLAVLVERTDRPA